MKRILTASTLAMACVLLTGCASIVDGGRKSIQVNSDPPGATFTVYNREGATVDVGTNNTTPAKIKLKRYHNYFMGEQYKLVFEAPGFYSGETVIKSKVDGWYFGNLLFGGLIGLVIVDPLTGSMWTLSPRALNYNLLSTSLNLSPDELKEAQAKANEVEKKPELRNETKKAGYR